MNNLNNIIYQYTTKSKEDMIKYLQTNPQTFYFGIDPTGSNLHLGHLIGLNACIELIKMGWKCIILIGGFTGIIGDPDKNKERTLLDENVITQHTSGILTDVQRVLAPYDIMYVNNREWLDRMSLKEYMMVCKHISINKKIKLDNFARRIDAESPLSAMEFIYPDLQGIDFCYLNKKYGCTLQIGGGDQWGNISFGVSLANKCDISEIFNLKNSTNEVMGFSTPLLTIKGGKMGKTTNNAVSIYESYIKLIYFLKTLPHETQTQLKLLFNNENYVYGILIILYHDSEIIYDYMEEYDKYMMCDDISSSHINWYKKTTEVKISNIISDVYRVTKERAKIIISQKSVIINGKIISENIKLEHGKHIIMINEFMKYFIEIVV